MDFLMLLYFVAGYSTNARLPPLFTTVTVRNYKPHSSLTSTKAVPAAGDCCYIDGVLIQLHSPGWPGSPLTAPQLLPPTTAQHTSPRHPAQMIDGESSS